MIYNCQERTEKRVTNSAAGQERESASYAERSWCVDLKRGVMGRAPWCKNCSRTTREAERLSKAEPSLGEDYSIIVV
jgi:hypothetical protein